MKDSFAELHGRLERLYERRKQASASKAKVDKKVENKYAAKHRPTENVATSNRPPSTTPEAKMKAASDKRPLPACYDTLSLPA
jgi:hypothetical protein